jgi:hypothetical protein
VKYKCQNAAFGCFILNNFVHGFKFVCMKSLDELCPQFNDFSQNGNLVDALHEDLLVSVLEGEVERLRREVPDHVDDIAAPEREEALGSMS